MAERDVAALRALKDILRGLVWAEEALAGGEDSGVTFSRFFEELSGAIEAATYQIPFEPDREEIIVADVVQARGVIFRAVAVLGLAATGGARVRGAEYIDTSYPGFDDDMRSLGAQLERQADGG